DEGGQPVLAHVVQSFLVRCPDLLPAGLTEAMPRRHTSPPAGFQQPHRTGKSLELHLPQLDEGDTLGQRPLDHLLAHQDLTGAGVGGHRSRPVDAAAALTPRHGPGPAGPRGGGPPAPTPPAPPRRAPGSRPSPRRPATSPAPRRARARTGRPAPPGTRPAR